MIESSEPHKRIASSEGARKIVHIAFGFCALLLRWLTWEQALAFAAAAFIFNWLIMPRVGGRWIAREPWGYDRGILYYPIAVFLLILLFRDRLEIAGAIWAILAFGDGAATLIGRNVGRRPLPWNRDKTIVGFFAFIEVGLPAAWGVILFLAEGPVPMPRFLMATIAVIVCAVVESLPLRLDDNIVVPFAGAVTLAALYHWDPVVYVRLDGSVALWLGLNVALAIAGWMARSVTVGGAAGGAVIGSILIIFGGWQLYVVLLVFFVLGSAATRLGFESKTARGIAQEKGGRRGFTHAFANVGTAALLASAIALTSFSTPMLWLAAAASLATAAADTLSSEIGKWLGRRAWHPLTFRPLAPGTIGAVSMEGTLAGFAGALTVSIVAVALAMSALGGRISFRGVEAQGAVTIVIVMTGAAFVASYLESVLWRLDRPDDRVPGHVMNFVNTVSGAALMMIAGRMARFW